MSIPNAEQVDRRKIQPSRRLNIVNLYIVKNCCAINSKITMGSNIGSFPNGAMECERMSLSNTMSELQNILSDVTKDLSKVEKGNKAAAQRVRVGTLLLEKVGKMFRKESLSVEKGTKVRKKKPKKRKR